MTRLMNNLQVSQMLAQRALAAWEGVDIGQMSLALVRRYLSGAVDARAEARVVVKDVLAPPFDADELAAELDLTGWSVRYLVDLGLAGSDGSVVGMVMVVRAVYADEGVHALVVAAPATYGHWGLDAEAVAGGTWPPNAPWSLGIGGNARRLDA